MHQSTHHTHIPMFVFLLMSDIGYLDLLDFIKAKLCPTSIFVKNNSLLAICKNNRTYLIKANKRHPDHVTTTGQPARGGLLVYVSPCRAPLYAPWLSPQLYFVVIYQLNFIHNWKRVDCILLIVLLTNASYLRFSIEYNKEMFCQLLSAGHPPGIDAGTYKSKK